MLIRYGNAAAISARSGGPWSLKAHDDVRPGRRVAGWTSEKVSRVPCNDAERSARTGISSSGMTAFSQSSPVYFFSASMSCQMVSTPNSAESVSSDRPAYQAMDSSFGIESLRSISSAKVSNRMASPAPRPRAAVKA